MQAWHLYSTDFNDRVANNFGVTETINSINARRFDNWVNNVMSWGAIMGNNRPYILQQGFTIMYPGLAIFITVLSISLVGDGLNDALNPKLRKR